MTFKWKREQVEYLITCMQEHSCIYNVRSTEYMDRVKKAQAFNSVLDEMKKIESAFTLEEIKRKWKILRTQYMQELRSMNSSKKSGSGATDIYTPKLWCFEQLDFLRTHSEIRKSADNTPEIIMEDELSLPSFSGSCTTSKSSSHEDQTNKRKKRSDTVKDFSNHLESFKSILMQKNGEKKYAWLGTLVTNQMEEIRPENQPAAAWEVQCLMQKLTNQYRERTSSTSSSKDIIELSMEGIFSDDDFETL